MPREDFRRKTTARTMPRHRRPTIIRTASPILFNRQAIRYQKTEKTASPQPPPEAEFAGFQWLNAKASGPEPLRAVWCLIGIIRPCDNARSRQTVQPV